MSSLWLDRPPVQVTEAALPSHCETVVVGAGITGLTCALLLAQSGRQVTVVEGRQVGAAATGNTTAKVSLLHGDVLTQIRRHHGADVAAAYVTGNRQAQLWLRDFMESAGVPFQVRDAITFADSPAGVRAVDKERQASEEAGLEIVVAGDSEAELPFTPKAAIRLSDQLQIDPLDVLSALATAIESAGGTIVENTRATGVSVTGDQLLTEAGPIKADHIVLATGAPFIDRSLYFAKLAALRSYAMALRTAHPIPSGMYLSLDDPAVSLRTAPRDSGELLLVGGHGHPVGRTSSEASHVASLRDWARSYWPDAQVTHTWSAQDYQSANYVPFVGPLPITAGRVQVATGFNKWGMTNGVAAAMTIAQRITGTEVPDWARRLGRRLTTPRDLAHGASINAGTATAGAKSVAGLVTDTVRQARKPPRAAPAEGEGRIELDGVAPVAVSTVDGRTCRVSGLCTHLGGLVQWNDQERSWDCPLHGSRFAPDGSVLEGMATKPLGPRTD